MSMSQTSIPLLKLQNADVSLAELVDQFRGQPVGFEIPRLEGVMLLLPSEDFDFVTSVIQAREALPTRPSKTPAEYFIETVRILRRLERRYGMISADFYCQFQEGALQEGPADYWEWRARYKSLLTMKERFGFSETEVVYA
ncbi:MAG: hypothetical protein CVU38_11455 [Chloroflexi bacterium HGW-Chloroflexi-1]|nr:MAG: hypothetical protein CVU38_11455 [Chloroflexi bacterium HGW-Chloroflexi-1]